MHIYIYIYNSVLDTNLFNQHLKILSFSYYIMDIPEILNYRIFIQPNCFCNPYNDIEFGHVQPDNSNILYLPHRSEYKIGIINYSSQACIAVISIDGIRIGKFQISKSSVILLERGLLNNKKFIYTSKCKQLSVLPALRRYYNHNLGIIKIIILPETTAVVSKIPSNNNNKNENNINDTLNINNTSDINKNLDIESIPANIFGGTVPGSVSDQLFQKNPYLKTKGKYSFTCKLLTGPCSRNKTIYIDTNITPIL